MTSHIRHRRGLPYSDLIEPGELAVDPVNRQLTAGDIDAAAGVKVPLLAIRYFDERASYVVDEYVVYGDSIYRSLEDVAGGPFNPAQWEAVVGGGGGGTEVAHTPLHGYGDGTNRTLILHAVSDTSSDANTIYFNNRSDQGTALIWTTGGVGDALRIQSSGSIALAPAHLAFDDSADVLVVDPTNVTIFNQPNAGLSIENRATGSASVVAFRNPSGTLGNLYAWDGGVWLQSVSSINLAPSHIGVDGAGAKVQVTSSGVHVAIGTQSDAYNNGALVVDGGAGIGGNVFANGNLTLGTDVTIANAGGYLVMTAAGALYLRSPSVTHINDLGGAPTIVGAAMTVNGPFMGVAGGMFQNDLRVYRSSALTTGAVYFGTGDHYLYYDGTDLHCTTQRLRTIDPVAGPHAATKSYVDAQISAAVSAGGPFLPLAGGTMAGEIRTAHAADIGSAASVGSIHVEGNGPTWGAMSFSIPGVFGSNFGLKSDGNFWMGGWSHGFTAYKFWTTRELTQTPFSDIRLAYAADAQADLAESREPFPGAVMTGMCTLFVAGDGDRVFVRYRYLQVKIGSSWFTVALA